METAALINKVLELVDTTEFKMALKVAHASEPAAKAQTETETETESTMGEGGLLRKASSTTKSAFEIERSVFPSLSNFLERLDDQLFKSY